MPKSKVKSKCVKLANGFSQVCVWPAASLGDQTPKDFNELMKEIFDVKSQFLEVLKTKPDMRGGLPVPGTGGRSDIFFAVHDEDVGKFAIPRFKAGIRWIEDFIDNGGDELHDKHIKEYRSW